MYINYMKESALTRLKSNITNNVERYKENKPWISEYFETDSYYMTSNINIDKIKLLMPKSLLMVK